MRKLTKFYRRINFTFWKFSMLAAFVSAFFLPSYVSFQSTGNNMFTIYLDGESVGIVGEESLADEYLVEARRNVAKTQDQLMFIETDMELKGEEVYWGKVDNRNDIVSKMETVLKKNVKDTMHQSFTVKINEFTVNLASLDEVHQLLQAAIDKYDTNHLYQVELVKDTTRELNVLTTNVFSTAEEAETAKLEEKAKLLPEAGLMALFSEAYDSAQPEEELPLEDYDIGLIGIDFGDTIEVVESYMPVAQLSSLDEAIAEVTKEQEKNKIYEVVSGDTLSQIAENNNLSMEALIAMNDGIENENSMIRVGDEITVTVPEPELSVERQEENYYEESYDADVIYVDNDEWYTNQTKTLQEPSSGFHRVVAVVSYRNSEEVNKEIVMEDVVMEAVPKIVERGTIVPPTYIKPISGGRLSSTFGPRKRPTRRASSYHKGVDWSTPVGTAVMASSSGVVAKAGWGTGYGYVVYINHSDGKQTRYGHLSKVLVSVGQSVQQGQKIALSGNTGVSTGPHVHFEILVGGSQVNPLNYLN